MIVFGKKQRVYEAVYGSVLCNALFFRFLGFPERQSKNNDNAEQDHNFKKANIICFCAGMILGALTYFLESPIGAVAAVCFVMAGTAAVYAVLCYPEAGFIALLFSAPFMIPGNLIVTGALPCMLVAGCYFLKLARGKRTFNFEIFDLFVLMFCVIIFFGGAVSVSKTGSIRPAMMYLCFTLMYFVGVNMIRSKEMIMRSMAAVMLSAFSVAAIGMYQNYSGKGTSVIWQDVSMFTDISGRVVSTLENPNVLAWYLVLTMPFMIVSAFIAENVRARMPYVICAFVSLMCLVYTWSRGSWLGFIFLCLILFIIISRKSIAVYLGFVIMIPFTPLVLPDTIVQRFMSIGNIADSSTSYRVNIWLGTLRMIRENLIEGIGIGRDPFRIVYPGYSLAGIEGAPHSHSLYFQILTETGLIGLIVFIFIIFFLLQYCLTAMKKSSEKYIKLYIAAGMCAIAGMLVNGLTDYIWYNYRVYLAFWLVIALTAAICRFSLKNQFQNNQEYRE